METRPATRAADDWLDQARVRPIYSRHLVELLAEEGVAPGAALRGSGLTRRDLEDSEGRISHRQQLRIYRNAATLTERPDLGVRLGVRQRMSDHGILGYAIQSSADLGQALRVAASYEHTAGPLMDLRLALAGGTASLVLDEVLPLGEAGWLARQEMVTLLAKTLFALSDPRTAPLAIDLDLAETDVAPYRSHFQCPVRFGRSPCAVHLDEAALRRPLVFSDAETAAVCERRCAELLDRLGGAGGVVDQVREVLISRPGQFLDLDATARALGRSGRTLRRQLREASTSFRAVVEDVRAGLALDYLQHSQLSLDEIAALLGYTETSNFHRAFKRWTGHPPRHFRR